MHYQQQWQEIEKQLRSIQQIKPLSGYIRDGIVDVELWRNQTIRPLFIGKEAYGDGGWSITEHGLKNNPAEFCRKSPRSWRKVSYISYALQNNLLPYANFQAVRHTDKVAESLRNIAFINVGKHGGARNTPATRLVKLYQQNRQFLHEQIELCQPNIIIGWNTLHLFESDTEFKARFGAKQVENPKIGNVRSWLAGNRLFIAANHPASRVAASSYVDTIVRIIQTHQHALEIKAPSWPARNA